LTGEGKTRGMGTPSNGLGSQKRKVFEKKGTFTVGK